MLQKCTFSSVISLKLPKFNKMDFCYCFMPLELIGPPSRCYLNFIKYRPKTCFYTIFSISQNMVNSAVATFEAKKNSIDFQSFERFFIFLTFFGIFNPQMKIPKKSMELFFAAKVATALLIICEMENMLQKHVLGRHFMKLRQHLDGGPISSKGIKQ